MLRIAFFAAALVLTALGTQAADYPNRPIRLIISSAVGGSSDIVTRILAGELVKQMGQQVIIDNRPGAAQTIGTEMVVRATPDGYTIGYANVVTLAINKSLLPKQPYDPDRDLVIVGQVQVIFDNLTSISPHVRSGKVRGLGVSSLKRTPIFPDLPTISEAGVPGYETNSWGGIVVPVGTPRAIVVKLNAEINRALQSPLLKERYAAIEAEPVGGTPEAFAAFVKKETVKWAEVVKKSGARLD